MSESKRFLLIGAVCLAVALAFDGIKCVVFNKAVQYEKRQQKVETPVVDLETIERAVSYRLAHHGRKLSDRDFDAIVKVIYIGHHKYGINYHDVLSMISTESEWRKHAQGKNYKKIKGVKVLKSIDYGLTQQNSKNLSTNYRQAARILRAAGIKYNMNDKFDVALNVMACIWYLDAIRKEIGDDYTHHRMIASYNTGIVGYDRHPKLANAYYTRFTKMKSI